MSSTPTAPTSDRVRGGIIGLLVGDAVGVPYEFKRPNRLPPFELIDMIPPEGFSRSWSELKPGVWSDDGAQALCLLEYYLEDSEASWVDRWSIKLLRWYRGHRWVDGKSFDCGIQTQQALQNMTFGKDPLKAAPNSDAANGNGSLMRTLPVALMNLDLDTVAFHQEVSNISCLTHPHPVSLYSCIFYCEIARLLLTGSSLNDAIDVVRAALLARYGEDVNLIRVLDGEMDEPVGSGYVVNSLWSAIYAIRQSSSFEETIKRAVAYGNDTDTTACIAGGLAGIIYGFEGIPARWVSQLPLEQVQDIIDPAVRKVTRE